MSGEPITRAEGSANKRRFSGCRFCVATRFLVAALCAIPGLVTAQTIYLDHSHGDIPRDQVQWAADVLSLKTGMNYTVSDTTISPTDRCIDGGITLRRMSSGEQTTEFASYARSAGLAYDCPGGNAAVILLHPDVPVWPGLLLHELSHTAGCWQHLDDPEDTMYWMAQGQNGLTQQDILCILSTPFWPVERTPDLCSTLILPDKSLYIPEIREHSARVQYSYSDGANRPLFYIAMSSANQAPQGCPGYSVAGDVATIPAAFSPDWGWFRNVTLLKLPQSRLWQFSGAD